MGCNNGSLRNILYPTCIWDISNFNSIHQKVGEYIESPPFSAGGIDDIKWQLRLFPHSSSSDSFISIYLYAVTFYNKIKECQVAYNCFLWDNNQINTAEFIVHKFNNANHASGYSMFLSRDGDILKNHFSKSLNNTLSIACCIKTTYYDDSLNQHKELIKTFDTYFLSEYLSDIAIEIDNKNLKAHKIILSAKSKVFSAMLKHNNTVEHNESIIKITDISYDAMKEILRFIYCGKVENLDTLKEDLLVAADKYDILSLKKICEEDLLKNINVVNVCEILIFSDLHQYHNLKDKAIEFIIKNKKEIIDSKEFEKIKDNSELLTDILRQISKKY